MTEVENRRPLKSRGSDWAQTLARRIAATGLSPNAVSATSTVFAAVGAALLVGSSLLPPEWRGVALIAAAACIQGRLVCNLIAGMVAVEHGRASSAGPIWNALPDRVSDLLLLAGAGYAAAFLGQDAAEPLGWLAAALAILTAYVRELGRALGQPADFSGPMAKPQRMAVLTVACIVSAFEFLWGGAGQVLLAAVALVAAGSAWTVARRVRRLAKGVAGLQAEAR